MEPLGFVRRLSHQAGCRGSPAFDAITTQVFPTGMYMSGTVRVSPVFRPAVVSSRTGLPIIFPPSRPPVTRKSHEWSFQKSSMALVRRTAGMSIAPLSCDAFQVHRWALEKKLGDVANHFIFENERVKVWQMVLESGEASDFHEHTMPYLMCIVEGESIDADFPDGRSVRIPVTPGTVFFVEPGSKETAVNRSAVRFREILVELKDG